MAKSGVQWQTSYSPVTSVPCVGSAPRLFKSRSRSKPKMDLLIPPPRLGRSIGHYRPGLASQIHLQYLNSSSTLLTRLRPLSLQTMTSNQPSAIQLSDQSRPQALSTILALL